MHNFDALELFEIGVPGCCHCSTDGTHEVRGTVGNIRGPVHDFFEWRDATDLNAISARKFVVVRLLPPVPTLPRSVSGSRECRTKHRRVSSAGNCLDEVAGGTKTAISDDVNVAPSRFVEVVASRTGNVCDRGGHWCSNSKGRPCCR